MELISTYESILREFPLAGFLPIFVSLVFIEALAVHRVSGSYPWKSCGLSLLIGIFGLTIQAAARATIFSLIAYHVYALRLYTISANLSNWKSLIALFLLTDLAFYVGHRCAHGIRILWASHSVHHTTEQMNLAAAIRLPWTPVLAGIFFFYMPIVWIGFEPEAVSVMVSVVLAYNILLHTEFVKRVGYLEWLLNTPSSHRVHHGTNKQYINKNFGGVLLIWDHLLGTYQAELPKLKTKYGNSSITNPSSNIFIIVYGEFWRLLKDIWKQPNFKRRVRLVFGPP